MIYVCPHPTAVPLPPAYHRLYAFPAAPQPPAAGAFVILDSGAFAAYQQRTSITARHMARLAEHYRPYAGQPGYHCIAPDVYLDPRATLANWRVWQDTYDLPVVPVIQFPRARCVDLYSVTQQARAYAPARPAFVAISNPGLTALAARAAGMAEACALVRTITGCVWLHNLGAGWRPDDIAAWRDLACFDSIDSIAYYTDAQQGVRWRPDAASERPAAEFSWTALAADNATTARALARGVA